MSEILKIFIRFVVHFIYFFFIIIISNILLDFSSKFMCTFAGLNPKGKGIKLYLNQFD